MVTLAFAQMASTSCSTTRKFAGGTDGIYLNVKPVRRSAAARCSISTTPRTSTTSCSRALALRLRAARVMLRSPLRPRARRHPRQRAAHARARLLDLPLQARGVRARRRARRRSPAISAAAKDGFVNPEMLAWHQSGAVLLMLILGGMGTLRGAVLGAFAFVAAAGAVPVGADRRTGSYWHWRWLRSSPALLLLPHGLIGLAAQLRLRVARAGCRMRRR